MKVNLNVDIMGKRSKLHVLFIPFNYLRTWKEIVFLRMLRSL